MLLLRQSTSKVINFGPFVSHLDGKTPLTSIEALLDAGPGLYLSKNGNAFEVRNVPVASSSHNEDGFYRVTLDTTDTASCGILRVEYSNAAVCFPVWQDYMVLPANVYDSLVIGTASLTINSSLVADAVWDEAISGHLSTGTTGAKLNSASSPAGVGAVEWTYTITDSVSALPIADVSVWVSTDLAGTNIVASGTTNAAGLATFWLDSGTYFVWRSKAGVTFTNPDTEVV